MLTTLPLLQEASADVEDLWAALSDQDLAALEAGLVEGGQGGPLSSCKEEEGTDSCIKEALEDIFEDLLDEDFEVGLGEGVVEDGGLSLKEEQGREEGEEQGGEVEEQGGEVEDLWGDLPDQDLEAVCDTAEPPEKKIRL